MRSDVVTKGVEAAPHRSLLYACGLRRRDFGKPLIGLATSATDLIPGHVHMPRLERAIEKGIHAAGGVALKFGIPGICDGVAMGHRGMHFSLPSRELIADMVETIADAHALDGLVLLTNCDKITPGMLMAAARLDLPTIVVTAGPMMAGMYRMKRRSLVRDVFEALGQYQAGKISKAELEALEEASCPGGVRGVPGRRGGEGPPGLRERREGRPPGPQGHHRPPDHDPRGNRKRTAGGHGPWGLDQHLPPHPCDSERGGCGTAPEAD